MGVITQLYHSAHQEKQHHRVYVHYTLTKTHVISKFWRCFPISLLPTNAVISCILCGNLQTKASRYEH